MWTPEQLLARAAFNERQADVWKGNAGYADTLRMEAWALRTAAELLINGIKIIPERLARSINERPITAAEADDISMRST